MKQNAPHIERVAEDRGSIFVVRFIEGIIRDLLVLYKERRAIKSGKEPARV